MRGIVVLYGYQGAGKGTIGQSLKQRDYDHISTGDVMRELERSSENLSPQERQLIKSGQAGLGKELVELLTSRVFERVKKAFSEDRGVILDGFPKTIDQCEQLDRFAIDNGLKDRMHVILIEVDPEAALERVLTRLNCEKCNWVFNARFAKPEIPGKCDQCAGNLVLRSSDTAENTKKRHQGFEKMMKEQIKPYYGDRLKLLDGNIPLVDMIKWFNAMFKV